MSSTSHNFQTIHLDLTARLAWINWEALGISTRDYHEMANRVARRIHRSVGPSDETWHISVLVWKTHAKQLFQINVYDNFVEHSQRHSEIHEALNSKSRGYRICQNKRPERSSFRIKEKNSKTHQFFNPPLFEKSPITTHRFCVLLSFEKSPIRSHRFCVLPPLKKYSIKSHRFCVLPPLKNHPPKAIGFVYFEKSLFLVGAYFGVGVYFGKYGIGNSFQHRRTRRALSCLSQWRGKFSTIRCDKSVPKKSTKKKVEMISEKRNVDEKKNKVKSSCCRKKRTENPALCWRVSLFAPKVLSSCSQQDTTRWKNINAMYSWRQTLLKGREGPLKHEYSLGDPDPSLGFVSGNGRN